MYRKGWVYCSIEIRKAALFAGALFTVVMVVTSDAVANSALPSPVELSAGWQLQDTAKVTEGGVAISTAAYRPNDWFKAMVPGTVLSSLVNNGVYPEPLYGENNRPDKIPESLNKTPYWYRTSFVVPKAYKGRQVWLNFDGINYAAEVWVNGSRVGTMRGAFIRGTVRCFEACDRRKERCGSGTGITAAASGCSARAYDCERHGQEWWRERYRWTDLSFHHGMGLDTGDTGP